MYNPFAWPTPATLGRHRSGRDALLRAARAICDGHGGTRRATDRPGWACGRQCKLTWARTVLGFAATAPDASLGAAGGRP